MEQEEIQRIRQKHMRLFGADHLRPSQNIASDATASHNMGSQQVDRSEDATAVQAFISTVSSLRCSGCRCNVKIGKEDVVRFFKANGSEFQTTCFICGTTTCIGCGETLVATTPRLGNTATNGDHFMWHCDKGRIVLFWSLLCGFDNQANHNKLITTPQDPSLTKKSKARSRISGVGYSLAGDYVEVEGEGSNGVNTSGEAENSVDGQLQHSTNGDWYFEEYDETTIMQKFNEPRKRVESPVRVDPDDLLTAKVMSALSALLPSPTEQQIPTEFDFNPPRILASLLRRSSILDKAADLLRNNSLEDTTRRYDVYDGLINFVRALANGGPVTAAILQTPRTLNKAGHDLLRVSYEQPTRFHNEPSETAQSLASCATNLLKQSDILLKNATMHEAEYLNEESQQMLMLCTNIAECAIFLRVINNQDQTTSSEERITEHTDKAVLAVPDEEILSLHHYAAEANNLTRAPVGRMRDIIKDIVLLQADLPSGIFVRHGETRLDFMKILIVGPQGTPYENGLFEFDLQFPLEYPRQPPKMFFRTTGGGTISFNPNLYADGKTCISILNTWSGEQWQPGKSTVLQVLVSIQAMIFCAEPWCNEPGRERMYGSRNSKNYNHRLYWKVVKFGMLEWIEGNKTQTPPPGSTPRDFTTAFLPAAIPSKTSERSELPCASSGSTQTNVFRDVAKKHFEANREDVIKTVKEWIKDKQGDETPPKKKKKKKDAESLKDFLADALEDLKAVQKGHGFDHGWTSPPVSPS